MTGTASSSAAATSSRATSRRGRRRSTGRASRRRGRTTSFPLPEILDRRALNRATLARQLLLERSALRPLDLLEGLGGLQAQTPQSPYVSAWSRLDGFDAEELSALIRDRRAVRVALMRSTIHLVSARDCLGLRPLVQPSIDRQFTGSRHSKLAAGAEVQEVAAAGRALLREEAVSFTELGRRLALQFPGSDAGALAMVMRTQVPLVQIPPRGLWRQPGAPLVAAAEDWLREPLPRPPPAPGAGRGKPPPRRSSLPQLVRRYLAAFGPASVRDFQTWSGLNRMREPI